MKKIYKYSLCDDATGIGLRGIAIPRNSEILSVQAQKKVICIWMVVDTDQPLEHRKFEMLKTGDPIRESSEYERKFIGTVQLDNGNFVLHVFELIDKRDLCPAK